MEQIQKPLRKRRSRQQIMELLHVFENAGLSVAAFCHQQRISISNFHKWKSRYKNNTDQNQQTSGFACLEVISSCTSPALLFAEVRGIKIFQPVSASFLKELLS